MSAATTLPNNPDTLWKILPRSATQLERDILTITRTDDLRGLFKLISRVKRELEPDGWLPLLLTEYGFSEIAKYHTNWRLLLSVSKDLRGKWGTPYAVEAMAKLLRYDSAEIWEEPAPTIHFPEFQMNLGQFEPDLIRLARLRQMVNVVKPARGRFRRIFSGWDDRQMAWDDDEFGELWDSESGVDILPLGVYGSYRDDDIFIVSLGLEKASAVSYPMPEVDGEVFALIERTFVVPTYSEFYPVLDFDSWDGEELVSDEVDRIDSSPSALTTFNATFTGLSPDGIHGVVLCEWEALGEDVRIEWDNAGNGIYTFFDTPNGTSAEIQVDVLGATYNFRARITSKYIYTVPVPVFIG